MNLKTQNYFKMKNRRQKYLIHISIEMHAFKSLSLFQDLNSEKIKYLYSF